MIARLKDEQVALKCAEVLNYPQRKTLQLYLTRNKHKLHKNHTTTTKHCDDQICSYQKDTYELKNVVCMQRPCKWHRGHIPCTRSVQFLLAAITKSSSVVNVELADSPIPSYYFLFLFAEHASLGKQTLNFFSTTNFS